MSGLKLKKCTIEGKAIKTQSDAILFAIQEAEKVPALEKEIKTLHETIVGNRLDENNYLKEIAELKDSMKVDKETQEDVVWRLKKQAEKVPALEKRVQELEDMIKELENIITDYEFHESCESALRDESDIGDEK